MIAVIPARGGSQRIPRKNIKKFHGKPIMVYSIETAQESGLFDEIIVSTEDIEIGVEAVRNGVSAMYREPEYAEDQVGTQEVARQVLKKIEQGHKYACVIYATSPLLSPHDLRRGFKLLKSNRSKDYAYSVDNKGDDAGNFYFGKTQSFISGIPLDGHSVHVPITEDRVCDINTMDDWQKAEQMFKKLRK